MFLCCVLCFAAQSCLAFRDPIDCSPPGSSVHGIIQARTRVGCHALLQGIFPTQASNPGLPHCREILYHLSHQGSVFLLNTVLFQTCILECGSPVIFKINVLWPWKFSITIVKTGALKLSLFCFGAHMLKLLSCRHMFQTHANLWC